MLPVDPPQTAGGRSPSYARRLDLAASMVAAPRILFLADRIAVIHGGRVVADDTPAALKRQVGADRLELRLARSEDVPRAGAALSASAEGGSGIRHEVRTPDALIVNIALPMIIIILFLYVFGGAITIGSSGLDYIDFVVPAVLLMAVRHGRRPGVKPGCRPG
ncbi:hypothetical protein [Planomonospora venezuelensis]|uniref:Uncharacterized protein n=1 Tax=Planomonospora venezuelensis TaxID=1999 RepID=A0A841DA21_PLAVE|nr:hypothetical protein [Planomonospora venezuelensis]MBB5965324.1 hypothetical protein [Planomonospora venezuelensis]GIN00457.1 hypothetical protein Pve01_21150 [Planomonospora venezuelensis]